MAGRGSAPKDPSRRARRNQDAIPTTVLTFCAGVQPVLPDGVNWPAATRQWWRVWGESAQAALMTATDWSFLLDTALIHAKFWRGDLGQGPELRLRVAKYGATLEDRARLRIQFADADKADAERPQSTPSRERRGVLHALPTANASGG